MYFLTSNCDRHCHAKFQSLSFFLGRLWTAVTQTLLLIEESKSASSFVSQQIQRYAKTCQLFLAAFCPQNAIPGRVSSYPLSVAVASRVDCSAGHLRHVLFVSRCSKASIDRQRRSISRVPLAKLSHGKRILLANFLVFWSSCANGNSSGDQVQAFSSLQKVFFTFFSLGS